MKNKKIITVIVAGGLTLGVSTLFAKQQEPNPTSPDTIQNSQINPNQNQQSPPSAPGNSAPSINEPAGAVTAVFDKEKFIKETAHYGMTEVSLGQIGIQKAQDPAVKEFAQKLVTDHSKLNDQLKELASKKGITLSTEVDPRHQKMIDHLSGLSGAEFDKAFAMHMAKGHKKDIAMFKKAAANTEDAEIRDFANNAMPTLQEHLKTVQQWAPDTTAEGTVEEPSGAEKKVDSTKEAPGDPNQAPANPNPDSPKSDTP
ncbi:MAG: DUF4142 domain-containing protein [Verrucomicrobiota bacterium]